MSITTTVTFIGDEDGDFIEIAVSCGPLYSEYTLWHPTSSSYQAWRKFFDSGCFRQFNGPGCAITMRREDSILTITLTRVTNDEGFEQVDHVFRCEAEPVMSELRGVIEMLKEEGRFEDEEGEE